MSETNKSARLEGIRIKLHRDSIAFVGGYAASIWIYPENELFSIEQSDRVETYFEWNNYSIRVRYENGELVTDPLLQYSIDRLPEQLGYMVTATITCKDGGWYEATDIVVTSVSMNYYKSIVD